ncbi:MAG: serine hydrolase domain-containing protein [Thermomicrobiales bacterium]
MTHDHRLATPVAVALNRRTVLQATALTLLGAGAATQSRAARAQEATPQPEAPAANGAFPVDVQLALHEIVERNLAATESPGALVGVWQPGHGEWQHAAGLADITTGRAVSLDDHVRIASNSKAFTATAVLQLVDDGLVGLDDPIETYVPGIPNGEEITVRQVLGMDAGIADYIAIPEITAEYAANPMMPMGPDEILAIIRSSTPDYAPGAEIRYSNSNYIVLGFLLEAVTGQTAEAAITERVITPLGLTGTSVPYTAFMPEPSMHGYFAENLGDPLIDVTRSNPRFPWTAGSIISTLADMRAWGEALAQGTLLSPETQAARETWRPFNPAAPGVAYGLGLLNFNGLIGHNGGIAGYSSWILHEPASGFTIVIVVNRAGEKGGTADPFLHDILALLLPGDLPSAATPTA